MERKYPKGTKFGCPTCKRKLPPLAIGTDHAPSCTGQKTKHTATTTKESKS